MIRCMWIVKWKLMSATSRTYANRRVHLTESTINSPGVDKSSKINNHYLSMQSMRCSQSAMWRFFRWYLFTKFNFSIRKSCEVQVEWLCSKINQFLGKEDKSWFDYYIIGSILGSHLLYYHGWSVYSSCFT